MGNIQRKSQYPYKYYDLTEQILRDFYTVYNALGYGFLEKVYQNALFIELSSHNLVVYQQHPITVEYSGNVVGEYYADLVVNDLVILEIKATKFLMDEHEAQLLNYLKATPYEVGLLLNFGPKPDHKRKSFDNIRKEWWISKHPIRTDLEG